MNNIKRITIDTNPDDCNLNCIMCDTHSIHNRTKKSRRKPMNKDLLAKIFNEAVTLGVQEIIPTTMGEPLLYKNFDFFIDKLKGTSIKLNLTTNGTLLDKNLIVKLLKVLSDIKISINSINPKINENIMIGDNTLKKLSIIEEFIKLKNEINPHVTITLQVTFLRSNLAELEDIIKFAVKKNINRVKGHHLWINYAEIKNEAIYNNPTLIEKWNHLIDKLEIYKDKILLVNFEKINSSNKLSGKCPFLGKEIWIDYNGDINICCAPNEERAKLGKWGNIQEKTIEEVINSEQYIDLLKNYLNREVCQRCPLKK